MLRNQFVFNKQPKAWVERELEIIMEMQRYARTTK